jgi:hypothetical protein
METQKFRVFNRSRERFLSLEVSVVDTTSEPFKMLIEELAVHADIGLWLKPYRGIPAAPGLPPFYLVYLDKDYRVVQEVESYPSPEVKPLNPRTASALVLPARTIFASQTLPGDQLEFSVADEAEEMERRRQVLSSRSGPGSVAQRKESAAEEPTPKDGSAPTLSDGRSGRLQRAIQTLAEKEAEFHARQKGSLKTRFLRWLNSEPSDRRRASRHPLPGLVAYHWTGGAPKAYHIGDISDTGFYLLTEERPFLETIVLMTLQITGSDGENPGDSIAVRTKVVRWGADGVGLAFVLSRPPDSMSSATRPENGADQKTLEEFLKRLNLPRRK